MQSIEEQLHSLLRELAPEVYTKEFHLAAKIASDLTNKEETLGLMPTGSEGVII